jgi:hypothetical protein
MPLTRDGAARVNRVLLEPDNDAVRRLPVY